MFQLCCRGQDLVGVAGGIGQKLLVNYREKILPSQSLENSLLVRRDHSRVTIVDNQGLNRWSERWLGQSLAELDHIDRARRPVLPVRARGIPVECLEEKPSGNEKQSSTALAPRSNQSGEAGDRAEGHRPMTAMFHANQETDHRRGGARVCPS